MKPFESLNRKQAPFVQAPLHFDYSLPSIKNFNLDNQIPVYYLHDEQIDVIEMDMIFNAGNMNHSLPLIASFTNRLLKSGTTTKTAKEIDEYLEHYGVHLELNCYAETAHVNVKVLYKHIAKILPLLKEIFTESIFPQTELSLALNKAKQQFRLESEKGNVIANKKINTLLFGQTHPYGRQITIEDYDHVQQHEIQLFYQKFYQNALSKIFIAGHLPPQFEHILNLHFGTQPIQQLKSLHFYPVTPPPQEKIIRHTHNEAAVQSSIRMGMVGLHKQHPDFFKARFLNVVFGGYFGSRLMKEVREKKGYTYGIHSYIQNNKHECAWMITSETGNHVCEKAIMAIHKEMKKLQQKPITQAELELVKNFYLGIILGDLEGALPIMAIWKSLIMNDVNETFFERNIHSIKTITADDITTLAIKYLDPKKFTTLIVQ